MSDAKKALLFFFVIFPVVLSSVILFAGIIRQDITRILPAAFNYLNALQFYQMIVYDRMINRRFDFVYRYESPVLFAFAYVFNFVFYIVAFAILIMR